MARAAFFADIVTSEYSSEKKFEILGNNTGNDAFIYAISNIIELDRLPRYLMSSTFDVLSEYDAFVTSDLIWITQGADAPDVIKSLLDNYPDKKIVSISMGLQSEKYSSEFCLTSDMVHTLERISERSVIAVRGNYTAEILLKHKISNIEIVGCPSVYQYPLFQNTFDTILNGREVNRTTGNFRTFFENLSNKEVDILSYFAKYFSGFVEQTPIAFSHMKPVENDDYEAIRQWLNANESVHFGLKEWIRYCSEFDFSMGSRFHGNIVAMLAGIRSLLIVCDTRTQELSEFFSLPSIPVADFDPTKKIADYYELADFGHFVSDYHNKISRLREFLAKNGLNFSPQYVAKLESFTFNRIGKPWQY